jgi:hypothetical protein
LRQAWRRIGAPIADHLRPGLTADRLDELAAAYGFTLPHEARVWWSWHDGSSDNRRPNAEPFPGWWLPSLERCIERAAREWERYVDIYGDDVEDEVWRRSWLPVLTDIAGEHIVIDCVDGLERPSPLYLVERTSMRDRFQARTASFGQLIEWWIEAIDVGAVGFDGTRLVSDDERFPAGLRAARLG